MRTFQYLKPGSLSEALHLLEKYGEKARLIAGGTDLMVLWKKRVLSPDYFISLRNIPELNFIHLDGELRIGSATPHRALELSCEIRKTFPVITDAVCNLGSVQVRNSGTIGGNICNAAPSADSAPPLLVLDTQVKIASLEGERYVPIEKFFKGPGRTDVQRGEIVTEFSVAQPLANTGMAYWKHTRRKAMDLPVLGVAAALSFDDDISTCVKARIALGVASPTPMRAKKAEAHIEGKRLDEKLLEEAGEIAASEASPRTTIRGSDWYRREMVRVLVKRAGLICCSRAKGESS